MERQQKLEILRQMITRRDCYAIQHAPTPDKPNGWWERKTEPVTDTVLEAHLNGFTTIGFYGLRTDSRGQWLAFDFDSDPIKMSDALWKIIVDETEYSGAAMLESTGGRGRHIFIRFKNTLPGIQIRAIGKQLLDLAGLSDKAVEIYPKQNAIPEDGYGNLIRMPFGFHRKSNGWAEHIDGKCGVTEIVPDETLVERHSAQIEPSANLKATVMSTGDFPCWLHIMNFGVDEGERNQAGLLVAQRLWRQLGAHSSDQVLAGMVAWNVKNRPPLPDGEIETLIKQGSKPYGLGCASIQKNALISRYCFKDKCSIGQIQIREEAKVNELLARPDLLQLIESEFDKTIVGERSAKITLFLVHLTCLWTPDAMHATISSKTGAGKSHVQRQVCNAFPLDRVHRLMRITKAYLERSDIDYTHKIVELGELVGMDQFSSLRQAMSERQASVASTDKTDEGRLTTTVTTASFEGTSFSTTTTEYFLKDEYKNRTLVIPLDETRVQDERVLQIKTQLSTGNYVLPELTVVREIIDALDMRIVPYVHPTLGAIILAHFPRETATIKRDYDKFMFLIRSSAFLHQRQRPRVGQRVYATAADLKYVLDYCMVPLTSTLTDLAPRDAELVESIRALGGPVGSFVGASLRQILESDAAKCAKRTIKEKLPLLVKIGALILDDENRPYRYRVPPALADFGENFDDMLRDAETRTYEVPAPTNAVP